jgi:hypothetical protein
VNRRRNPGASRSPSGPGAWAVKWIGGITAVISLILGAQQLTTRIGDALHRRREAATQINLAHDQASRGAFADAWASLDRADALRPGESVDSARVEIAFAWLQDARPGPGRPFSVITDAVTPTLDRALLNATGARRADLLAHVGWATFLRSRDGVPGDPASRYRDALSFDSRNVYANTMLGHWLMWTGSNIEPAREHFAVALAEAGEKRAFVRRFQIASLSNRGDAADGELLRVADDMRQHSEPLEPSVADRIFRVFTIRYGSSSRPEGVDAGTPPANLEATYDWVVKSSAAAARSSEVDAIRARVRRRAD